MHEGVEGQSLVVLRPYVSIVEPSEIILLLGERRARVHEGVEGQSVAVLRLHVSVVAALESSTRFLVSEGQECTKALEARVLWFCASMSP